VSIDQIVWPLAGGALIGLAASGLLLFNGRILGVTGIFAGILRPHAGDRGWRLAFVAGLLAGGFVLIAAHFPTFPATTGHSAWWMAGAGLLVGYGTRLANGCTSGHGVCGISRLSRRSIVATITFISAGAATVYIVRHVVGA
jgi:uncharacterized membrane protein YedE/YeeE